MKISTYLLYESVQSFLRHIFRKTMRHLTTYKQTQVPFTKQTACHSYRSKNSSLYLFKTKKELLKIKTIQINKI